MVFVPKKDGSVRLYVYYRRLNEATVTDTYKLPRMEDWIDSLGYPKVFTTIDANC